MKAAGKFYGIGVGPGDPELLTRKAARILAEVDWIFLPATATRPGGYAGAVIESLHLDVTRFRPVMLSMSSQRENDLEAYTRAAEEIRRELRQGKSAAWITEGDPLFYSTFMHVWSALEEQAPETPVEIVPGITSMQAAAAAARIPVACLDDKIAILPAVRCLGRLAELLTEFTVLFLLKVHGVFGPLLDELASLSQPLQATYVERVGTAQERIVKDLPILRGEQLPYFSMVILRGSQGRER